MKNFKLAVGDIVRIKSLEWFEENKKKAFDTEYVEVNGHVLTKEKQRNIVADKLWLLL